MDDIDRLTTEEVRQLLQLVKSNADFPQMIYLLLAQRDILESCLNGLAPGTGRGFLEKIVQVPFDVPTIQPNRVQKFLTDNLDVLISHPQLQKRFNKNHWLGLYIGGIRDYFVSLRDVRRYLGVLSFHLALFEKDATSEVNPIDLIALETLRVFEPDVYVELHNAKEALTDRPQEPLSTPAQQAVRRGILENIIAKAPAERRARVQKILIELFPAIASLLGTNGRFYDEELWQREVRVSARDIFERYFYLTLPEGTLSESDLHAIEEGLGDRNKLVSIFRNLRSRGLLVDALDRLEAYKQTIGLEHADAFITAIFDIGDQLPEGREGFFTVEPDMHATRIIYWYLKTEPSLEVRARILKDAITKTSGLYLPVHLVAIESDRDGGRKDREAILVDDSQVRPLQELCLEKLRAASKDGRLLRHLQMMLLLYRWKDWAGPDEARDWVDQITKEPEGALNFLKASVRKVRTAGGDDHFLRISWRLGLSSIRDFIDPTVLKGRIAGITDYPTAEDRRARDLFMKAMDEQTEEAEVKD